jgi:hypothetical protein
MTRVCKGKKFSRDSVGKALEKTVWVASGLSQGLAHAAYIVNSSK